jgi:hypothetical protein
MFASISKACCKRLFKMMHLFSGIMLQSFFDMDVAYISNIFCNSMFQMLQLFQSYVVSCKCFIECFMCFIHMLQVHVSNVSSVFSHMLHFHVASVLLFSAMG